MKTCHAPTILGSRFVILDGLRFAFALIVMVGHLTQALPQSYLAVDFFFVLSGFVLTWTYWERVHEPGVFRSFLIDRIARLYPLHLATLGFLVVLELGSWMAGQGDPGHFLAFLLNLTLLQSIGPALALVHAYGLGPDELNPWNGPAWSVSVELYGTLLLAAALLGSAATALRFSLVIVIFVGGSYVLLGMTCYGLSCENFAAENTFTPVLHGIGCRLVRGLGAMALGALCCGAVRHLRNLPQCLAASPYPAALSGGILLALVLLDRPIYGDILALLAACVLVSSIALYEHRRPVEHLPVLSKALLIAGALSYGVYLLHTPLILATHQLFPGWINNGALSTAVVSAAVITIAFPVYYLFEIPLKRSMRGWLAQLFARPLLKQSPAKKPT